MTTRRVTVDGNEAAAHVAYRTNEVIAIYPITPSSPMGEHSDAWSAVGKQNIWGSVPQVTQMQSEAGAAGAIHGALQAGALSTTFTSSQGLLLMIPNMYKIAGELTATVFHIAARAIATQGLSIFGDHSDVMAVRQTGWGVLFGNSVQEAHDFALISQATALKARVPFLHCMDGFRTSHEVQKISLIPDEQIKAMIDDDLVRAHRLRGLTPDRPALRGTAQNPDVYFQARETVNPYYMATPGIVQGMMDRFAELTGRQYHLFDYVGAPDAERVIIQMGSGCETTAAAVRRLVAQGEKVGLLMVRLFRPWDSSAFIKGLPATVKAIAVLDRTKEPGSAGEPLYQDVLTAVADGVMRGTAPFTTLPRIIGGRYGLGSKEYTPAMAKVIFDELKQARPKSPFTIGIIDDVTDSSLPWDPTWITDPKENVQAMFFGLGSDGTVGANKNSIKIIGEGTDQYAQGYFVYDSKKSGSTTTSHLRFGPERIEAPYLIQQADFIGIHQFTFLDRMPVLENAKEGATVLLNAPYPTEEVWDRLPRVIQTQLIQKKASLYVIDAVAVAKATGMGRRINTIMQTCFFYLAGVLPQDEAIKQIKKAIEKTYAKRGQQVVDQNFAAVDASLAGLHKVEIPAEITSLIEATNLIPADAPEFVQKVTAPLMAGQGDLMPVSAIPVDGTYVTGTTKYEKRNICTEVPVWDPDLCIQCGKCVNVCPHAVIRAKLFSPEALTSDAPETFLHTSARFKELPDHEYTIQVSVEDCTGCTLCVEVCPAKDRLNPSHKAINMEPVAPIREAGIENWDYFLSLPEVEEGALKLDTVKNLQTVTPLFEFSGACAGCGETPYLSLLTRLFGDRMLIANATGCSSIYGGNLPTTPWTTNDQGRGPAWANSLFEDNAEFGLGMQVAVEKQSEYARELLDSERAFLGDELVDAILTADQSSKALIDMQRARVETLKSRLQSETAPKRRDLLAVADMLVKKSLWIIGGDGWAYDIGFSGLDHVMATGHNVNILVMDTEVYSNTGGQSSKATPKGAVAKFAAGGKKTGKKDMGTIAMSYGNVYVAQIAMGANDAQTVKVFQEAEAYDGPSIIIAYSHCVAHGYDMAHGMNQQKLATESGHWPLYRFDPRRKEQGLNPLQLDSKAPKIELKDYVKNETRYSFLEKIDPNAALELISEAQGDIEEKWRRLEGMSKLPGAPVDGAAD
ncbi:MAG TPA: pyruvate:ferredoxin (flavodoxin) oxidoreductase [Symbiobacteriaceae bacterium]|nr:pyruvate:ferredoxin (flavodoxin) oxidoreductase [Symbiobacteriaceae bacterium]